MSEPVPHFKRMARIMRARVFGTVTRLLFPLAGSVATCSPRGSPTGSARAPDARPRRPCRRPVGAAHQRRLGRLGLSCGSRPGRPPDRTTRRRQRARAGRRGPRASAERLDCHGRRGPMGGCSHEPRLGPARGHSRGHRRRRSRYRLWRVQSRHAPRTRGRGGAVGWLRAGWKRLEHLPQVASSVWWRSPDSHSSGGDL
jgi:hypothetical protein